MDAAIGLEKVVEGCASEQNAVFSSETLRWFRRLKAVQACQRIGAEAACNLENGCESVFTPARVDPAYDAVNRFSTTAGSNFNGATVTLNRQFQDDFELLAGYTYSKTIDDASSDLEQPQNPFYPGVERALSQLDQRHRFTLSGLWLIGPDLGDPADAATNANQDPLMRIFNGLD